MPANGPFPVSTNCTKNIDWFKTWQPAYRSAGSWHRLRKHCASGFFRLEGCNRRTSVTYPNTNKVEYLYNVASELTTVTYKRGTTTLGTLLYTYDAAGNRIKTGGTFGRSNIPPALTTTTYNANNQQTAFGAATETYDLNGNLATFTDANGTTTYTWNTRNQLTAISGPGLSATFTYDSFGRRTGKTINTTTTNFVYDGLNPIQEKAGATVIANLLTGLGIDEFFTRTDGVGVRSLLPDALGSTVALGDGTGTLQTQYTYEPFGVTTQTGSASTSSYKYTGREDDGNGLMYYRARYYQPRLQRFVSEDPIGLRGEDVNLYGYVSGNPVALVDPLGLASLTTDMKNGKTTFDPRPEDPNANPTTIDTLNKVTSRSQSGANDPLSTPDVSCLLIAPSRKYGPTGAYLDTGDSRGRDIHGGGSSLPDPLAPIQPLTPTQGCTRGHNQDLQDLCNKITDFKRRHPGVSIPYIRQ